MSEGSAEAANKVASEKPQVIAIVGPTATGKSELADSVAASLGTSVVSVDSMQVYRGMDVGTAKVPTERRRVPLLMVDVADLGEEYSVQRFQHDARVCVDNILAEGRQAVLCGGTGLYLNAVIDEMSFPAGARTSDARVRYEGMARDKGAQALWDMLEARDPESARLIHPNNVRRVVRALELADDGVSYARQSAGLHDHVPHYRAQVWALRVERPVLYERIDRRVDEMFARGLEQEVRGLVDAGLGNSLTALQAIGYKEVLAYLRGEVTREEAIELVKRNTRRYAKRQLSWFGRDSRVRWLDMDMMDVDEARRLVVEAATREGTTPVAENGTNVEGKGHGTV